MANVKKEAIEHLKNNIPLSLLFVILKMKNGLMKTIKTNRANPIIPYSIGHLKSILSKPAKIG